MRSIEIKTRDGVCTSYVFRPNISTFPPPWPGVLVFMDGVGIRPAMLAIGTRLAKHGYFALLPDLFYRSGPYAPMDPHQIFGDPEKRKMLLEKFFAHATKTNLMNDTRAFLDYLSTSDEVRPGGVGIVGYCMGGLMALLAAGRYPDHFVAAASYHGGRLATDAPESPHRLAPKMKARVYIGGATDDPSFPDDMKERLRNAFKEAGVDHTIETYPAKHGWVLADTPVHDPACAARHWETLLALFDSTLAPKSRT